MAKSATPKVSSILFQKMKGEIPSAEQLVRQAVEARIGNRPDVVEYVRTNFSRLVEDLQIDAYNLYLENERISGARVIRNSVAQSLGTGNNTEQALDIIEGLFPHFDKLFLSLTQSRRARAGTAFQEITSILLQKLGYPFSAQPILDDSKPDYVMPSKKWYEHDASDCIILTLKRTLRERWRQVPTEGNSGSTFFLATIDEKVPAAELEKMKQLNVRMVVPSQLKEKKYKNFSTVISFEYFFEHTVEPAMKRWKAQGAI